MSDQINKSIPNCSKHNNPAISKCNKCNAYLCPECILVIDGKKRCRNCYDNSIINEYIENNNKSKKRCPECNVLNYPVSKYCYNCGYDFNAVKENQKTEDVINTEENEINYSNMYNNSQDQIKKQRVGKTIKKNSVYTYLFLIFWFYIIHFFIGTKYHALSSKFQYSDNWITTLGYLEYLIVPTLLLLVLILIIKFKSKIVFFFFLLFLAFFFSTTVSTITEVNRINNLKSLYSKGLDKIETKDYLQAKQLFIDIEQKAPDFINTGVLVDSVNGLYLSEVKKVSDEYYKNGNYSKLITVVEELEQNNLLNNDITDYFFYKSNALLGLAQNKYYSYDYKSTVELLEIGNTIIDKIKYYEKWETKYDEYKKRTKTLLDKAQPKYQQVLKKEELAKREKEVNKISLKYGYYDNYKYAWNYEDGKYIALFQPRMLPRNDSVVIGAIIHLINKFYGKHQLVSLTPKLIYRNGVGVIEFKGINKNFYITAVKEDTGEVHTLIIWTE